MIISNEINCVFCKSGKIKNHLSCTAFVIKKCIDCSIAFTYPAPVLPDYKEMDFHTVTQASDIKSLHDLPHDWKKSVLTVVDFIKSNVTTGSNILEIGCGDGLLLSELQNEGFNVTGIEPSFSATKRAKGKGLKVEQGLFPQILPTEKQDAIILTHVYEHVPEPMEFMESIKKYLNPGGKIIFAQTNYLGLIPTIKKEQWYAWVPEHHYWHFSLKGLTGFMEKQNFKKLDVAFVSLVHENNNLYKLSKLFDRWVDQFIVIYEYAG